MEALKRAIANLPLVGPVARRIYLAMSPSQTGAFTDSTTYWDERYRTGRDSGAGSYSRLAKFKAEVLNRFVAENGVATVVEFGCGDGAQLSLADYPQYIGVDISPQAIAICRRRFAQDPTKSFYVTPELPSGYRADLALSLDVIYHLVEDDVFDSYMKRLFDSAERYVIVYSSNDEDVAPSPHVKHRTFTRWVSENRPGWELFDVAKNRYPYDPRYPHKTSFADFHFFRRA